MKLHANWPRSQNATVSGQRNLHYLENQSSNHLYLVFYVMQKETNKTKLFFFSFVLFGPFFSSYKRDVISFIKRPERSLTGEELFGGSVH